MTIEQTIEIPASRRITLEVPPEIPAGRTIIAFTPANEPKVAADDVLDFEGECPVCAAHRDQVTGEERFNAETTAAIREGRAMMRGEIPAIRFNSFEEMLEDLERDDGFSEPDDD
jgi:hypothetical protein